MYMMLILTRMGNNDVGLNFSQPVFWRMEVSSIYRLIPESVSVLLLRTSGLSCQYELFEIDLIHNYDGYSFFMRYKDVIASSSWVK